jgi:hypothetical protein
MMWAVYSGKNTCPMSIVAKHGDHPIRAQITMITRFLMLISSFPPFIESEPTVSLIRITHDLLNEDVRLVTLTGPGGVGKNPHGVACGSTSKGVLH